MKKLFIYCTLISIAILASCKKVELDPKDGEPVFSAIAELNGEQHIWQAGVEDYYMFSSYDKDVYDVYEFIGKLSTSDSSSNETISFRIRDAKTTLEGPTVIEAALNTSIAFRYANHAEADTIWRLEIDTVWGTQLDASNSIFPNIPVMFEWQFGDGTSDTINNLAIITHQYEALPIEPTTLTVSALNGSCSASLSKMIASNANSCDLGFDLQPVNPSSFDSGYWLTAQPSGVPPFLYQWSNGSNANAVVLFDSLIQSNSASVTVTDGVGCTTSGSVSSSFIPGSIPPLCVAAFDFSPFSIDTTVTIVLDTIIKDDSLQFSNVIVEYADNNGIQYSSFNEESQPSFSFFKLNNISDYDNNENGEKTKKLDISFACRVWNELGSFIDIKDGKAIIAVAYP